MQFKEAERLRQKLQKDIIDEEQRALEINYTPSDSLSIQYVCFQKLQPMIRKLLEKNFKNIKKLHINNCDLRTFENFPSLPHLTDLNAANNSMRGSFEFIVKNRSIAYIDISDNCIADVKRFEPLTMLKDISVYAKGNSFLKIAASWNGGITVK